MAKTVTIVITAINPLVVVVLCTNLAFLGAPHCRWWKYQMYQVINSFFCFEVMFLKTIGCELMRIRILCFCDYHLVMTNIAMANCPFIIYYL